MKALANIKIGWKWLERQLNNLIDAINARTISVPLNGGLDIQETPSGTMLSLSKSKKSDLEDRIKALEDILNGGVWTPVDVVDSSCVHSTINVLTKP
jgi:hypothetical protein